MSGKTRMYRRRDVKAYRAATAAERAEDEWDWRSAYDGLGRRRSHQRVSARVDEALRGTSEA